MGFFQGLGDAFGFGDAGAGRAANEINLANERSRGIQSTAFGETERNLGDFIFGQRTGELDPRSENIRLAELARSEGQSQEFIDDLLEGAGGPGFEFQRDRLRGILGERQRTREGGGAAGFQGDVFEGARIGGLDARLGDIFGSQNFQNLRDERLRAVQGQLGAGGLTRSGTALQEIANVPTELGFGIESQQFGRASGILDTAINQQQNLENLRQGFAGNIASNLQATGQNEASGVLAGRQAQAAGIGNLASLAGGIATGGLSAFGSGALQQFGQSFQR